ncbi:MAG: NYN domain-containing protein [Polyangiales bacterium]|nr:NYN domain-containing protein [Myxococcales bacterium]
MKNNYFFVDGSSLLADVKTLREQDPRLAELKFNISAMVDFFAGSGLHHYHENSYRRFVFYFAKGDDRTETILKLPEHARPGAVRDVRIEYCGKRIRAKEEVHEWLRENKAPQHVIDAAHRAEKAVDTQICCDAMQLAAFSKLDRLFLYSNDSDFVPLCRSLRALGININLIRLTEDRVNHELVCECDAFDVMEKYALDSAFGVKQQRDS